MKHWVSGLLLGAISVYATTGLAQAVGEPSQPGEGGRLVAPTKKAIGDDDVDKGAPEETTKKEPLPWSATLGWEHSATTETLGIGQDVQTLNPTYEWTLLLAPRYKVFYDDDQSVSLSASLGISREFTNSDITTQRGEWTLTDWGLAAGYNRTLYANDDYRTAFSLTLPSISFPTSKFSQAAGKILGLQGKVGISQTIPILGSGASALKSFTLSGVGAFGHAFTKATTNVDDELDRERSGLDAEPTISDQLTGVPNSKYQVIAGFSGSLAILDELSIGTTFQWRPNWKYLPSDACLHVKNLGECFEPNHLTEPQSYSVVTMFNADISYQPIKELSISAGYLNIANQVGPDGQRRNMFYSPNARFYLTLTGHLDAIYEDIRDAFSSNSNVATARTAEPSVRIE